VLQLGGVFSFSIHNRFLITPFCTVVPAELQAFSELGKKSKQESWTLLVEKTGTLTEQAFAASHPTSARQC